MELKQCPFCGNRAIEIEGVTDWPDPTEYVAICQKCGATGAVERTEDKAGKSWNMKGARSVRGIWKKLE